MKVLGCFLAFVIQLGLVYSVAERCYFCNTEVHGESCEEPINEGGIQVQSCVTYDVLSSSNQYYSTVKQFFVNQNQTVESEDTKISPRVYDAACIHMNYTFSGRTITARGCEIEYIDTNIGTLDICEYYRQIIPARITDFLCSACTADLCNHLGYVDEAQQEEGNDEEEGGAGEPDGASAFSASLSVLIGMFLAKFYM